MLPSESIKTTGLKPHETGQFPSVSLGSTLMFLHLIF